MIDINLIRENPEIVKADLKKRKDTQKLAWIDEIVSLDKESRELKQEIDSLRAKRNTESKKIGKIGKELQQLTRKYDEKEISDGRIFKEINEKKSEIDIQRKDVYKILIKIKESEERQKEITTRIQNYMLQIPNIMHESVPYGKDDTENEEIKKWGTLRTEDTAGFSIKHHAQLMEALDVGDFERATKIAGKGFYILSGDLALLNQALVNYAIDFLGKRGFKFIMPPFMVNRKTIDGVTDHESFKESVYKVEGEDLHMIATSEHPIMGMHMNETIEENKLPLKYVGYSLCFRKEIGSHGIDEKGLFRVHQFHKVEQVVICKPEETEKLHEELLKNSEDIMQDLELPYQVVNICTGDLGIVAAKKYDVEAWMPRQNTYREVCSCSNCTDYQTRRLNIRYGTPGAPKNELAHSLNNTAIATSRILIAIMENYQNKDGSITIPKALRNYMGGKEKIVRNQ